MYCAVLYCTQVTCDNTAGNITAIIKWREKLCNYMQNTGNHKTAEITARTAPHHTTLHHTALTSHTTQPFHHTPHHTALTSHTLHIPSITHYTTEHHTVLTSHTTHTSTYFPHYHHCIHIFIPHSHHHTHYILITNSLA